MKITQANYFSEVYPKLDFAKLHTVFKEGHELISDVTENGKNWNTYKSIKEVETEVDAYFRNLNALQDKGQLPLKTKGSAKGKAVKAKATKAKSAKATRTTETKKVAAKRAANKLKVNKKELYEMEYKAGYYLKKNGNPSNIVKIVKVYPETNAYDAIFWVDGKKTEDVLYGNIAHTEYRKTQPEAAMQIIKMQTKVKVEPKSKPASKPKVTAKPKVAKSKVPAKPKATQSEKDKAKLTTLKAELTTVKAQVVANAKFKAKVGEELSKYLKSNGLYKQVGLSGIPNEIKKTEASLKFYKGLLAGDKADFKSIGKRVGIIYQVKPLPKSKKK